MPMVEDQSADVIGDGALCDLRSPSLWAALQALEREPVGSAAVAGARGLARGLARVNGSLELRIGRLAAWFKTQDLSALGYPSWAVFVSERLEFRPSWLGELVKLAQSRLNLVKKAVSQQIISLSVAIRAPGRVAVDEQEAWLAGIVAGDHCGEPGVAHHDGLEHVFGDDAVRIKKARSLAALCLGVSGPHEVLDAYIIECWVNKTPRTVILRQAREPRPTPDLTPPTWCDEPDPATELLGPWSEPTDLADGLRLLDAWQHFRRERVAALGLMLDEVHAVFDCLDWGHASFAAYVRDELQISLRTAQRYRRVGNGLLAFDELRGAVCRGLDLDRAEAVGRVADTDTLLRAWLCVVPGLPKREVRQLDERVRLGDPTALRQAYSDLLIRAPDLVARAMATTENGSDGARLGTTDPACIKVACRPDPPERRIAAAPARLWVDPRLVEASRWFLDTVQIPPETGFRRILEIEHHICQNPECQKRWISNHAHHDLERSRGGSDDPVENGRSLSKSCHLRLRHSGRLDIVKIDDVVVYLYPGRAVVVG